jgi:hemerythrin
MYTRWNETLITGVELIDKEHKEILIEEERLHDKLVHGDVTEYLNGLVILLMDYVNRHLTHEEELQKVIGYHLFEDHRKHHDEFRHWVKDIKEQLKHEIFSREELLALDYEINQWLVKHIMEEDMKIADYHDYRKNYGLDF